MDRSSSIHRSLNSRVSHCGGACGGSEGPEGSDLSKVVVNSNGTCIDNDTSIAIHTLAFAADMRTLASSHGDLLSIHFRQAYHDTIRRMTLDWLELTTGIGSVNANIGMIECIRSAAKIHGPSIDPTGMLDDLDRLDLTYGVQTLLLNASYRATADIPPCSIIDMSYSLLRRFGRTMSSDETIVNNVVTQDANDLWDFLTDGSVFMLASAILESNRDLVGILDHEATISLRSSIYRVWSSNYAAIVSMISEFAKEVCKDVSRVYDVEAISIVADLESMCDVLLSERPDASSIVAHITCLNSLASILQGFMVGMNGNIVVVASDAEIHRDDQNYLIGLAAGRETVGTNRHLGNGRLRECRVVVRAVADHIVEAVCDRHTVAASLHD